MKVLLTGASGFLGKAIRSHFDSSSIQITNFEGDVLNSKDLDVFFSHKNFDLVIHLAGISSPAKCESNKLKALEVNSNSLIDISNVLMKNNFQGSFIFFSSAHVYGPLESADIKEDTPLSPTSIYGVSKASGEKILERFSKSANYNTLILRLFNIAHISQETTFFIPYIIDQIKKAHLTGTEYIKVGNVNIERDFTSLPVFLKNFEKIIATDLKKLNKYDVINLCSGKKRRLSDIFSLINKKLNTNIDFRTDRTRQRKDDPKVQTGSTLKLKKYFETYSETNEEFVNNLFKIEL